VRGRAQPQQEPRVPVHDAPVHGAKHHDSLSAVGQEFRHSVNLQKHNFKSRFILKFAGDQIGTPAALELAQKSSDVQGKGGNQDFSALNPV